MFYDSVEKFDFGGFKYELRNGCFYEEAFHIRHDGVVEQLPVHGYPMDAMDAIKIHAMNSNGYCP